ncbi:MAG TPA: DUF3971 domain-containing protein [Xanthobacteraceae bacterium]|nr:DUF3971 domain-containing protein [Xanthobacteraceae bacterium]
MTNQHRHSAAAPPWERDIDPRPPLRAVEIAGAETSRGGALLALYWRFFAPHRMFIRRIGIALAGSAALVMLGALALWWRLASGPIQLDVVTPWLAAAIEENFGSHRHVEVGGTQIEHTESGGTAVRIRDIVVRDADGTVVASAPKAEVHVSGMSLLSGHIRAESLNLVGAEMAVRIEQNGGVTVFAGADKHPIATASVPVAAALPSSQKEQEKTARPAATNKPRAAAPAAGSAEILPGSPRQAGDMFASLLSRIDAIGTTGLDGHELRQLGLKNGNLTVDDERTGKHWTFRDIDLSVERARGGGVGITVGSDNPERPWAVTAAIGPARNGYRRIDLEARRVAARELLLASRFGDADVQADLPLSASISGVVGPDGVPQSLSGRIVADAGSIGAGNEEDGRLAIDHAEFRLNWNAANRVLTMPFQIFSGGNRITLIGQMEAPEDVGGKWSFKIGGGTVVLASPGGQSEPLILNRIAMAAHYDGAKRRFVVDEGDLGNTDVGVAMSGNMDFANDLRLTLGLAGTRMRVDALKRMWPVFVAPKVRDWVNEHLVGGTVERLVIAVNAPLETLRASGPPIPDDGLSIDALATGCVIRPVNGLPALRDADLNVHIVGRNAVVALGKATADLSPGRKLAVSSGVFEVPDTAPREPPARIRFKLEGPIPAAAELLRMDRLREFSDPAFEASTLRGTMTAQVTLGMPLKSDPPPGVTNYSVTVDASNFSVEHMIMGQKVEAATLRAGANPQGFQLKGEVKIGGTPASLEYRKLRGDAEAEVHIQGMFDEAARNALGFDTGNTISGGIPVRLAGRVATASDRDGRFAVEADLTPAQINGLLPGWAKPSGKPARATFTLATKAQSTRIEDLLIEGAGGGVKGAVEFDGAGELQSANFPAYGFSDGDRASLKVERASDGALRVIMRGEVYDGRGFIKSVAGAASASQAGRHQSADVDLDMKVGAVVGFDGEALRSLDLKMSRRAGEIRSFGLTAKIGRDATLSGDLRGRPGGRQVVYLDTNDAGAFFRFTDVYARMTGGQMSMAMDPPSGENAAQQGILSVRDFTVHDEAQLQRAVANAPQQVRRNNIEFSGMRVEFTRMPGRVGLRDGVVRGPLLGGTIDGVVDYTRDEMHLRGTLVPLYGPNNLLGQLPLVGLFLGGEKEGLVGITYEVVGQPGNPELHINPISALAPGLLRKVFEFPTNGQRGIDDSR